MTTLPYATSAALNELIPSEDTVAVVVRSNAGRLARGSDFVHLFVRTESSVEILLELALATFFALGLFAFPRLVVGIV